MRYTNNMEPGTKKVRSILSHELAHSIESKDGASLVDQLSRLKDEESPTAVWAEAIGTRLQIRDFLVQQKNSLLSLRANQTPDLRQDVTDYLHALDAGLSTLTGYYGQERSPATPKELKIARLDRLTIEPADNLVELTAAFSSQDSDKVLPAGDLVDRTVNIRNDVVERLWSAAQTFNEGDPALARTEFDQESSAVNDNFDQQIGTILAWEEVAK